ncbi:MAG: hypothetical protein M8353_07855 [ANME-2 cluster archaeon]|nr:hypothetical protein [ANME-2 cluster archaeon]
MFYNRFTLLLIFLLLLFPMASATTIHGIVYEWSTFEPLDNALVEVNSTPAQFRVAASGVYSFNLPPGEYLIKTRYYTNNALEYYAEDNITVTDMYGDYVFDILVFPWQNEGEDFPDEDIGNITYDVENNNLPVFDWTYSATALLVLLFVAAVTYYHYRVRTGNEELEAARGATLLRPVEPVVDPAAEQLESGTPETETLPDDLNEILEIVRRAGGRVTQKELRNKLRCSEAKVSLMVTDLEDRGLVRKVKQGRGNVILLNSRQ